MSRIPRFRPWFWALAAGGHGPDWHFFATFGDAARLAAAVSRHLPPDFVRDVDFAGDTRERPTSRRYVDQHTHDRLTEMRAAGAIQPIWYSGEIEVDGANLAVRHFGSADLYDETSLLLALARSPDLALGAWQITWGGDFVGDVARGEGAAALLAYLDAGDAGDAADAAVDGPRRP